MILDCTYLNEFPSKINKLINLPDLNLPACRLSEMPSHIGQLKSLHWSIKKFTTIDPIYCGAKKWIKNL